MKINEILKGLSVEQREQEKELRAKVFKGLKRRQASRLELGRLLIELHDKVVGEKRFKEYLEVFDIARRSAYRWMRVYKLLSSLPDPILRAANKRNIDLGSEKFEGIVEKIPAPENPSQTEANEWLDEILARQKESGGNLPQSSDPSALTLEQRMKVTTRAYVKHCRAMESVAATCWSEIPAEERRLEVAQCLMGVAAARLGIAEPFTVTPDASPEEADRLAERLEARMVEELEVEEEVAV